jgi:tight adherence protein B
MRRLVRLVVSTGALATLTVWGPGVLPAHAEDEITIDHVQADKGRVDLVLSVDGVPGGVTDLSTLKVTVDGRLVDAEAKTVSAGDIQRSTVLVLDASNSMQRGGKFDAAKVAIDAFLESAPPDVAIGLVTFAGKITESIEPTTDHETIRAALAAVTLKRGTSVYDGIQRGVELAGTEGSRSLLVLSDGADTNSQTTLDVAGGEAETAGVIIDVVSLTDPLEIAGLVSVADDTGGSVIPADPGALNRVFTERGTALAQQVLVSFSAPEGTSEEASIDVSLEADGSTYTDAVFASLGADLQTPNVKVVESGKALVSKPFMLAGAAALALGLAGVLATVLTGGDSRSSTEKRLDAYFNAGSGGTGKGRRKNKNSADIKGSAVALTDKVVSADLETRINQRLAGAGSSLNAAEWVLLHAGIAVAAAVAGFILGGGGLAMLGLILGAALPWVYLKWRHGRRLNAFNGQLAQTLGLMAGGLQAGLSLPQAVDSVVKEGHQPMAGELQRALIEQRLGIDITDALEAVGHRMESADFGWVVMAIRIQREVGGNLAEILHTVADTLREREYLRRQVKALSAEGRLSGYILTALPVLVGLYMTFANPEYVSLLYTTVPGFIILGLAGFLLALGSFAMAKLAKVEV